MGAKRTKKQPGAVKYAQNSRRHHGGPAAEHHERGALKSDQAEFEAFWQG